MSDFKGYWKNYEDENYVLGSEEYCAQQAWKHQQAKIDDLQKTIVSLEAGLRKNSSNKQKLLSKNIEMQKRVDAAKQLIEDLNKCYQQDHQNKFEYWRGFADSAGILGKRLEQALKGGDE